jgi:hypothetical protein
MRETYQNFLAKHGSTNVRNVPGQDYATAYQGMAGQQGKMQSQFGTGYQTSGNQLQQAIRNPSTEQAGQWAKPSEPPIQLAPTKKMTPLPTYQSAGISPDRLKGIN